MRKPAEPLTDKLLNEHKTIEAMTRIYCRDHHKVDGKVDHLCDDCREFRDFANSGSANVLTVRTSRSAGFARFTVIRKI